MTNNSKQCCFRGNTRGFTLIEVLIAMAIFSIGILGVAKLQLSNVKNNTTGNIITMATMLGRARIDELKGLPLDQMEAKCLDADEPEIIAPIYERECDVDPQSVTSSLITVTVSWNRRGQNRRVVLTTITRGNGT